MNKTSLLLSCATLCLYSSVFAAPLYTFEDNKTPGDSWDADISIVANPSTENNNSTNCLKATFKETWGAIATFSTAPDYSKYGLTFLVYLENPGEVAARAYDGQTNYEIKQSVFDAKKWTRVSFDFSKQTPTSNSIIIFTGSANTIYVDDIELVALSELSQSGFSCDGMDVPYSYGTLAIGGGGFVSGIISCENTKIARTDVGGAYKWNASNCSWKPLTNFISEDDKGLYSIDAAAIDPQNENNIYLLAGAQYFSSAKTAILYSNDGGESFNVTNVSHLIYTHGNGDGRNCGERIAVDPNNSKIIYCGGRAKNPLIKSENGGASWSAVSSFPSNVYSVNKKWNSWDANTECTTTEDDNGTTAVVFDGSQKKNGITQRIFVGISRTNASNVYVSEDGGASWSAVTSLPTDFIPCKMRMDPNGNLLIAYSNKKAYGTSGAIYRYNPNTQTAVNISPRANIAYGDVVVSNKDANKLVACTNNTWISQKWDNGQTPNGDIYWTSTDGGVTWRSLQDNMVLTNNNVTWIPGYQIHWSTLCMDANDDSKVSVGSGNGIFTCNNIWCEGTPTFYFDVNGLEETVPLDLVSIPKGDLLSVIGDYTGFIHNNIHEFAPIHDPAPGTTGGVNYYSKNANVMMRVANSGFYYTTTGHSGWKSMAKTNYAYTNPYCNTCDALPSNEGKCAITKINDQYRFFLIPGPGESGIYYSDNNGASWTKITETENATNIQVDPVNDAYVYAGGNNTFYSSSNYGESFTASSFSNDGHGRITILPGHEGLIYAPCGGNGLKVSTDHGKSWNNIKYVTQCSAVGCGKGTSDDSYTIYIWGKANGCEIGLYRSINEGESWQRINDDKNQFGGPGNGDFVIGDWNTYGRFYMSSIGLGIIYGEISENHQETTWNCFIDNTECKKQSTSVDEICSTKFQVSPNPFTFSCTLTGNGEYSVTNLLGVIVEKGTVNGQLSTGEQWTPGIYFILFNDKTTKVIKE